MLVSCEKPPNQTKENANYCVSALGLHNKMSEVGRYSTCVCMGDMTICAKAIDLILKTRLGIKQVF